MTLLGMSRIFDVRTRRGLVTIMVALTLTAAACSSEQNGAVAEVASLQTDAGSDVGDAADAATVADAAASDLSADEVALEFSQCMRDEGLDFPDLSVDANGDIDLREGFQSVERNADGFGEAMDTCGSLLEGTAFGGGRGAAQDSPEFQDGLLAFSACVRDDGYDVGDLTLGGGPGGGPGGEGANEDSTAGAGPVAGDGQEGQRQGGFGNRGARFAENLGLDYEDPAVAETIDACMPIIDEAFAGFGPQGAGTNTGTTTETGGTDGDDS